MKTSIYLESSVISYLAAKPSRDPVKAARQLQARALWNAKNNYDLVVSTAVIDEISQGNPAQAGLRRELIQPLRILSITSETDSLAVELLRRKALPAKAFADAVHMAIATTHRIGVMASFNFRHLASVFAKAKIEQTLRDLGYSPPLIATPEEILGASHD